MLRAVATLVVIALAWPAHAWDRLSVFDEATTMVEEQFFDPDMNGLDWPAVTAAHRARITPDMDREAFAAEVNSLLGRLEASHTSLLTRDTPDWYQLAGVFLPLHPPLGEALEPFLPNGAPVYAGIGVMLDARAEGHFVTGVLGGFPARSAGVLVGDRIVSVDGQAFHPIRSFAGREGRETRVTVERRPGEMVELTVTPVLIDGRTMFEDAMRASTRVIEEDGARIGYIRAWSYAGQKYQDILFDALMHGALADADALVLDVRGGWGGASPSYLNIFTDKSLAAASTGRNGETRRFTSAWTRPVVLLTDEGSRSGKELIAYGFRALGKGPIVGETTAGAVLAGRINALSDGSLLYVAVADVTIGGERLEGRGVPPDIEVPFDPPYAAGADPQLDRAVEIAAGLSER